MSEVLVIDQTYTGTIGGRESPEGYSSKIYGELMTIAGNAVGKLQGIQSFAIDYLGRSWKTIRESAVSMPVISTFATGLDGLLMNLEVGVNLYLENLDGFCKRFGFSSNELIALVADENGVLEAMDFVSMILNRLYSTSGNVGCILLLLVMCGGCYLGGMGLNSVIEEVKATPTRNLFLPIDIGGGPTRAPNTPVLAPVPAFTPSGDCQCCWTKKDRHSTTMFGPNDDGLYLGRALHKEGCREWLPMCDSSCDKD